MEIREDGILAAGSNPASLTLLGGQPADEGTYTSEVLDASQISLWGTLLLTTDTPSGENAGAVKAQTRSGNVADPEIAGWSEWIDTENTPSEFAVSSNYGPQQLKVNSPPARFLQYRLTLLGSSDKQTDAPVVEKVELAYVTPNLRPGLASLTASYPDFPGVDKPASTLMNIEWEATDDNGDRLLYHLDYQPLGSDNWIELVDNLTETSHEWDTRTIPDGPYRLRITVSDRLDNPGGMAMTAGRRTDPLLVDNAPPMTHLPRGDQSQSAVKVNVQENQVELTGVAIDRWTPIHSVAYLLAGSEEYQPVLADDLIYDSTVEPWSATLSDLESGSHSVTIRMIDLRGNATYVSQLFEVP